MVARSARYFPRGLVFLVSPSQGETSCNRAKGRIVVKWHGFMLSIRQEREHSCSAVAQGSDRG